MHQPAQIINLEIVKLFGVLTSVATTLRNSDISSLGTPAHYCVPSSSQGLPFSIAAGDLTMPFWFFVVHPFNFFH